MLKKLLTAGVMLALVAAVGFAAIPTSAQSVTCANIDSLLTIMGVTGASNIAAAKAAVGCGVTAPAATFTRSLTLGSNGADVTALQNWLISQGYQIPAGATGYFGAQTQTALKAYQVNKGITPAVGYFGPLTIAAVNAQNVVVAPVVVPTTPVVTPSVSGLEGTDGTIATISQLSQYDSEDVGAGQEVKVAGFEVKASKDGDIQLKSIKLTFDSTGRAATDSSRLTDYVDTVSIMVGSDEVAVADASDFTRDSTGIYSKTLSLDDAILEADKTEKVYIVVKSISNLDSGDIDSDSWTVGIVNIRYVDGGGVTTTEVTAIPTAMDYDNAGDGVAMDFVSFSAAADTELKISLDSSSPDADIVMVSDTSDTNNVVLVKGKIQVKGDSDIWLDELPVTLTVGNATDIDNVSTSLTLTIDGEDYVESVSTATETSATVTFDNLDLDLDAGKTYNFTISADILALDGVVFDEGDTLLASLTTTNRGNIVAENEEGDSLAAGERTGSATGKAQEFRTQGVSVTLVSVSESKSNSDTNDADAATYTIKFKVTAIGEDAYLATVVANSVTYVVDRSGVATTAGVSAAIVNNTDTSVTTAGAWLIDADTSETITLTVLKSGVATAYDGLYRASLTGIKWDSSDTASPANTYSSNLDSFVTDYVALD